MSGITKLMTAGGGGVSLTPASSIASDVTVNVPSQNCTLGIQGPAFSAYQSSAQSISSQTYTKVNLQTEEFDTNNNFDSTTNYRFTPTVAGYYQFNATVAQDTAVNLWPLLYKNGTTNKSGNSVALASGIGAIATVSGLIYLNGSTDYVELYIFTSGATTLSTGAALTTMQGVLVRAA